MRRSNIITKFIDLQSITNTLLMGSNLAQRSTSNSIQNHQQQQQQQTSSSVHQQQQQLLQMQHQSLSNSADESSLQNSLFSTTNMSKFFDFHKNQQQKIQNVYYILYYLMKFYILYINIILHRV